MACQGLNKLNNNTHLQGIWSISNWRLQNYHNIYPKLHSQSFYDSGNKSR